MERASLRPRAETLRYTKKSKNDRVPFVITHNPRNPPLRKILSEQHPILLGDETMSVAVPNIPVDHYVMFSCPQYFQLNSILSLLAVINVTKAASSVGNTLLK